MQYSLLIYGSEAAAEEAPAAAKEGRSVWEDARAARRFLQIRPVLAIPRSGDTTAPSRRKSRPTRAQA